MNRSERKEYRQQKKKLKQRRKESVRQEKETIRKQKREYKEKRKEWKRSHRQGKSFLAWLISFLNPIRKHAKEHQKSSQQYGGPRRQRKRALKEERLSIKREKHNMHMKTAVMRKRIRSERIKGFMRSLNDFLKHPVKLRKTSKQERFIRKQMRIDSRKATKKRISNYPSNVTNYFRQNWNRRFKKLQLMAGSIGDFFRLLKFVVKIKELRINYFRTALNSTVLFILAFVTVYYFNQFITIYTAKIFDIPAVLFSYRIYWPLYTYSSLYSRMALILIFGSGPLINLIMGFIFYRLYVWARWRTQFFKTYFIWAAIHSFTLFFGAYIAGVITRTGFIYSSEWLFLSNVFDVEEILFLIISMVVMVIIGYYSTKHFILASNSSDIIQPKLRIVYIISKVLLPWAIGNTILFLVSYPNNPLELNLLLWVSVLVVIPIFSNYNTTTMQMLKLQKSRKRIQIGWMFIIILAVVLVFVRLVIQEGISFS